MSVASNSPATEPASNKYWESFSPIEGQHWVANTFRGRGDLEFQGQLRFAGNWVGTFRANSPGAALFVLEGAKIVGKIEATEVSVSGTLEDIDVRAEVFRANKGSKIFGRIVAATLIIEEGALLQGEVIRSPVQSVSK